MMLRERLKALDSGHVFFLHQVSDFSRDMLLAAKRMFFSQMRR